MRRMLLLFVAMLASVASAVTLDPFVIGKNYESLTVSGSADAAVTVKLVDRTESSAAVSQIAVVSGGRFSTTFASLKAGHEYSVSVDDEEKGVVVLSRDVTDGWIREDADTYQGLRPGTGAWGGDGSVEVTGTRINIAAVANEGYRETVAFTPTNYFGVARGYRVRANISFEGEAQATRQTDGIFGVTLVVDPMDNERAVFYIIDGQSWKRTDFTGEIAIAYEFEFFVDEVGRKVSYYLLDSDGNAAFMGTGAIPEGVPTRFSTVDFQGYGSVGTLDGDAYDTKLIGAEFHFDGFNDDGSLLAGMNFTNLNIRGWVSVTNLWDTDATGGTIELRITGSDGVPHVIYTTDWSGFDGIYGITNLVEGLTRGENYTVEVVVKDSDGKTDGIADGSWMSHGITGRRSDDWYHEDALTVSGAEPCTGKWKVDAGISVSAIDGGIVRISSDGTVEGAKAVFTPTNAVPRNGVIGVNTFEVFFDSAMSADMLPDPSEELFGLSFVETADGPAFAVIVNGAWEAIGRDVFVPNLGMHYRVDVISGATPDGNVIEYYITDASGAMRMVASGAFPVGAKPYPSAVTFSGDGRFTSAVGEFFDTTLFMVDFDPQTTPGTNFTATAVSGTITVTPAWDTDCSNGVIRVTIRNGRGETVSVKDVEFHGSGSIDVSVDGLEPGESYTVSIEVVDSDGPVDGDVDFDDVLNPTAKKYDGLWIDENVRTFAKLEPGTGDWVYRKSPLKEAYATESQTVGPAIQIESELDSSVVFNSTDDSPAVVNSTIRELTFEICSEVPGYYVSAPEYAKSRPADLAGITIACDDLHDGALHFSVYNPEAGGSWTVLENTEAELNRVYKITVIITYPNPNRTAPSSVSYWLDKGGRREQIAFIEPAGVIPEITDNYRTRLRFSGGGLVRSIVGECYDAHLALLGGVEYWTIADAIHEIGISGRILTPLWYSTYVADIDQGWFGVNDPNNWLNIIWPLGYVVEITDRGDARFYLFHLSDYWIDWAVAEDAVATPTGWEVKSANGLAWLAKQSTNDWVNGDITLAQDITNLYEHIWTPIRGYTGTFDGNRHTIVGLTDKGAEVCWTNDLDMSVYGLFGTATDSVFRNVSFEGVSISNSADAVASLLGCSLGDLALTNIVVRSGNITGGGQFVSGIVGYIGDFDTVSIRQNVNAATLAIPNAPLGGVNVAGIANLGSDAGLPGGVTVVSNENRGAIETTINSAIGGGNVAQILAGSDPAAQFDPDAVDITGNIGTGDVSRVTSLNHPGWPLGTLPVVNLSSEVSRQSDDQDYKQFIEANDSTDVLIDPYLMRARMTGSFYQDGATNYAGVINDQITASKPGDVVTVQDSCEIWSSVELDRAITLDLDGKVIDNVFDTYTFDVTVGSGEALVKNGVVTHPAGKLATRDEGDGWRMEGVTTSSWDCDYWDRTLFIDGEFMSAVSLPLMKMALGAGSVISVPEDSAYSIDADAGTLNINGKKFVSFSALGYSIREEKDGGDTVYVVDIEDPVSAPEINLAIVPDGGTATVVVNGAKTGFEYCLQSVESLAESWDKAEDVWVTVSKDGEVLRFEVDTSKPSGFYRIKIRKQ